MEVFRISSSKYAKSLTASGASARWNRDGEFVLYTASTRSLATLELMVHMNAIRPVVNYKVMVISIENNDNIIKRLHSRSLPKNWRDFKTYSKLQSIGSTWYNGCDSLVLKIPSAIITNEYNYIINCHHPDFSKSIKLVSAEDFYFDKRLIELLIKP